ncbi:MAG: NEW3 domain-containing protein [archaeon]
MKLLLQPSKKTLEATTKLFVISLLCSVSVITVLSPSLSVYALSSNIQGFIEDESGESLGRVSVELLSGSSVVKAYTSNSIGYFYLNNVNYGQYTIRFIKSGYVTTEKTINLQHSETNLGTIVLDNAIQMSGSTLNLITIPDAQISIPFTVENAGPVPQIVDILTSHPEGWYTRIRANSYEVTKLSLDSGQSLSLQLEVVVPSTAPLDQEYNVSVITLGATNTSLTFSVLTRSQPAEFPSLTLHSSILNMVANSGEKLVLPFTVSNIGDITESIEFSVSTPESWSTRVLNDNGREITKASLSADGTANYNLELIIPMDYTGDTNLELTALGNTVATLEFTVNVEPVSESIMSCRFPGKLGVPGDSVTFDVTLTNPFNVETQFELSVGYAPANWTVHVTPSSGEAVTDIILGPDESLSLVIQVETASSAISDTIYDVVVVAESDGQLVSSLPLTVTLEGDTSAVTITTKFPDVTIQAGEAVEYAVTVTNVGDTNRLLYFSIDAPSNWNAVVKSGNLEVSKLSLDAGSSESLTIKVTPPSTVSLGSYGIDVQFTSESGAMLGEKQLTATVVGAYSLDLGLSTLLKSTTSGESVSFTATVTNTGYSYVTGVSLEFDVEDDWDVTISPTQVDMLTPQQFCTFEVTVDTPTGTVSGDYMVTVGAVSDQSSSDNTQVRVTVTTSSSWAIYGIGVAAVLIVALVLVFKKFRRR